MCVCIQDYRYIDIDICACVRECVYIYMNIIKYEMVQTYYNIIYNIQLQCYNVCVCVCFRGSDTSPCAEGNVCTYNWIIYTSPR